ncbi:hypothetical protein [Solirubrobacter soli]|uniref:hypothetical protein n=1 Tax=Solirubrobacter soli TaxID=363832 RepID=UPI00042A6467|nr:hypothetical protein [Solirubrobacter soli]
MASIRVKIGALTVHEPLDAADLHRRVERELAALLEREPLRAAPPPGASIQLLGGKVHAPDTSAPAVARALARRIHTELQNGEVRR